MGSMQHGPNGGIYRQVSSQLVCYNVFYVMRALIYLICVLEIMITVKELATHLSFYRNGEQNRQKKKEGMFQPFHL